MTVHPLEAKEPVAKVYIVLSLPTENLHDFLVEWDSYRDRLIEFASVESANVEMPEGFSNRIVLR